MATLSSLVAETTTIKNNLTNCHTNLKNILKEKGVSVSSSDKMTDLIKKVKSISTGLSWDEKGISSRLDRYYDYSRGSVSHTFNFDVPLDFEPTMAFVLISSWNLRLYTNDSNDVESSNVWFDNTCAAKIYNPKVTSTTQEAICEITSMSSTGITIKLESSHTSSLVINKVILIGEQGYNLDEQIKKKVKVVKSLPSTGTNGELAIIGDPSKLTTIKIVDSLPAPSSAKTSEVYIVNNGSVYEYTLDLSSNLTIKKVYLRFIYVLNSSGSFEIIESYFRHSDTWKKLPNKIKYLYNKGTFSDAKMYGYGSLSSATSWNFGTSSITARASYNGGATFVNLHFGSNSNKESINFQGYNKLNVNFSRITGPVNNVSVSIYTVSTSNSYPSYTDRKTVQFYNYSGSSSTPVTITDKLLSTNLSSYTGDYFVTIQISCHVTSGTVSASTYCEAEIDSIYLSMD